MTSTTRRTARVGLAALVALGTVVLTTIPTHGVEPGTTGSPADAAADWLARELQAKDGMLTISFGGPAEFADQGLTIDAVLALLAAGHGDDPAVDVALGALAADLTDYLTGFETPSDRAANATAKTLLLEEVSGADVSDGMDLDADLRGLMATDGEDLGRFLDTDSLDFGQFANGIGQALGILALDRTGGGVPADAVDYLLGQQCPDGSFRLYQFGYVLSFDPFETVETHTCEDASEGDPDATAFALQALLAVPSSPAVDTAVADAIDHLLGLQQPSGGFFGTGAVNTNTTGLVAAALRSAGEEEAADSGAAFIAALQSNACAEFGALAYDQSAFDAGIVADRGQWTRATAQGALGLGLPGYGGIGTVAPVSAGLDAITCPSQPVAPSVTASVGSILPGGTLTIHGTGFTPGEIVDATLHSTPIALGSFTADADGEVDGPVTIPADVEPGEHTIVLAGRTSGVEASVPIEVIGEDADPAQELPATGTATSGLTGAGAALVAVGVALVLVGRPRRAAGQVV
jgi:LPXTG-motif cell wall-anchored protein